MILSDREIKAALARGSIRITPDPRAEPALWSSTALDLRLGEQLEIWNTGPLPVILKPGMRICQLIFEQVDGTLEQGYEGQFAVQGPAS